jgi:RNA polymerase sigma factor (sigma-70 family)
MAMLQAIRDYEPARQVPLGAYVRMRIMASLLTRYRKEWAYAARLAPDPQSVDPVDETGQWHSALIHEDLNWALRQLTDAERQLLERIFWRQETEAEIARKMGLTQQAISRRKRYLLAAISRLIEPAASS